MKLRSTRAKLYITLLFLTILLRHPMSADSDDVNPDKEPIIESEVDSSSGGYGYFLLPREIVSSYLPISPDYLIPPEPKVAALIQRARNFEEENNYRQALKYYFVAFKRARDTAAAPYIRFKHCFLEENTVSAMRCLSEIVDTYPGFPLIDGVRYELARRYFLKKSFEQAVSVLQDIEENEKDGNMIFTPYVFTFMGIIMHAQNRDEEALAFYEQALTLHSSMENGSGQERFLANYIEMAKSFTGLNRYEDAEPLLKRIYGTASSPVFQAEALFLLAQLYQAKDQKVIAYSAYQLLTEDYPSSPYTLKAKKEIETMADVEALEIEAVYDSSLLTGMYGFGSRGGMLTSGFVVQLGSFSSEKNALRFIEVLKKKAFPAFSVKATLDDREVYRVRVGYYRTRAEAKEVKEKLESLGYNGFVVSEQ